MSCLGAGEILLEPVPEIYKAREKDDFSAGPLSVEESTAIIIELAKHRLLTTIVIDALDECNPKERDKLLDALSKILKDSIGLVKIFVSSWDDGDIVCFLADCVNLEIEANKNQEDIVRFVNSEVDSLIRSKRLLFGKVTEALKQQIIEVLSDKAGGTSVSIFDLYLLLFSSVFLVQSLIALLVHL